MDASSYLFILGRTPKLAYAELRSLFPKSQLLLPDVVSLEVSESLDVTRVMDSLGGTMKIAKLAGPVKSLSSQTLLPFIEKNHSVEFGCSFYGFTNPPVTLSMELKKLLEEAGLHARFVKAEHGSALSTVVVDKAHLQELIIVQNDHSYGIGKTIAVQPYEEWNKRDYDRPYADAKLGMLPPKVARMIVNIAACGRTMTMLDPFCGMGTIPAEGYMMAHTVLGSDVSGDVVEKAKGNLEWLQKIYPDTGGTVGPFRTLDAVHISDHIPEHSIDAIVTEPYMGSTNIVNQQAGDVNHIKNTIKGLEKLYIGCLRNWHSVLTPKGKIVIALPSYALSGREYFVKKVVDMCENLGYTIVDGPIEYSRPQAIVKRNFFVLQKNT
jgi:tRNA G10  N-methylase Trm11